MYYLHSVKKDTLIPVKGGKLALKAGSIAALNGKYALPI